MESFRDAYCLAEENGVWAGGISMEEADSSLPGVGLFGSGEPGPSSGPWHPRQIAARGIPGDRCLWEAVWLQEAAGQELLRPVGQVRS